MRNFIYPLAIYFAAAATGCATATKSTLLGAGSGAAAGGAIGGLVDPGPNGRGRIKNAYVGAAAGAMLGAGAGYLLHENKAAGETAAFEKGRSEGLSKSSRDAIGAPSLIPAKVETRFVDDQSKGSVFIPAHFEYIITEPAHWSN